APSSATTPAPWPAPTRRPPPPSSKAPVPPPPSSPADSAPSSRSARTASSHASSTGGRYVTCEGEKSCRGTTSRGPHRPAGSARGAGRHSAPRLRSLRRRFGLVVLGHVEEAAAALAEGQLVGVDQVVEHLRGDRREAAQAGSVVAGGQGVGAELA